MSPNVHSSLDPRETNTLILTLCDPRPSPLYFWLIELWDSKLVRQWLGTWRTTSYYSNMPYYCCRKAFKWDGVPGMCNTVTTCLPCVTRHARIFTYIISFETETGAYTLQDLYNEGRRSRVGPWKGKKIVPEIMAGVPRFHNCSSFHWNILFLL